MKLLHFILLFLCINLTSYCLPILIPFLVQCLIFITTIHEVQQINLIICLIIIIIIINL